jgi:hypothetical protein
MSNRSSGLKEAIFWFKGIALSILGFCMPAVSAGSLQVWNAGPEMKITPSSFSRDFKKNAEVESFRNEVVSLQFAARSETALQGFSVARGKEAGSSTAIPESWVKLYYPGYLLADEIGGYTSDPLLEEAPRELKAGWTQPVWIQLHVPAEARSGRYAARFLIKAGGEEKEVEVELTVLDFLMPTLSEGKFYLNIWQDPAAVARWAKVPLWSEKHWRLLEAYATDMAAHGQRSITTSILYDPWHSQTGSIYPSMVEWQFPGEWKEGEEGKFRFDYAAFDRYVEIMMKAGIRESILCVSMVDGPGATPDCDIGYQDTASGTFRIRHTVVGDARYRGAWGAFLPAFVRHLQEKGWLEKTFIAFDEKPQEIMNTIYSLLKERAPELKISLSGGSSSQQSAQAEELTIYWDDLAEKEKIARLLALRKKAGPTMYYTACAPALPNTFLYSPLWESRLLPWLAWHHGLNGYLRWAHQSWPDKVWSQPLFRWHSGDNYFVYPGETGPISSLRWELLRQGVQDFEALKILEAELEKMRSRPAQAAEAGKLEKQMRSIVANAVELHRCEGIPAPGAARQEINQLLLQVTGKTMTQPSPYTSSQEIISKFSPEGFVPDGNLEKEVWKTAQKVRVELDWSGKHSFPQSATEVATFWTATHAYFAFWCKYGQLNTYEGEDPAKERWELWNRDVVEVFLNPEPQRVQHYYEFEVAPNNQWVDLEIDKEKDPFHDAGWDSHFDHATRVDREKKVWTCEMRIPVAPINARTLEAGAAWRINFFRADGPGGDDKRRFLAWSTIGGDKGSFHVPERFGLIRFVK